MSVHISREESSELSAMLKSVLWVVVLSLQTVLQKKLLQLCGCDKSNCEPGLAQISSFCKDSFFV